MTLSGNQLRTRKHPHELVMRVNALCRLLQLSLAPPAHLIVKNGSLAVTSDGVNGLTVTSKCLVHKALQTYGNGVGLGSFCPGYV